MQSTIEGCRVKIENVEHYERCRIGVKSIEHFKSAE